MRESRGVALLMALLVVVLGGAVAAAAAGWAILAQQTGRGWRDAARRGAVLESEAAAWLAGDSLAPADSWVVVDSFEAVRFASPTGAGSLEVVCRRPVLAAADSAGTECLSQRGFVRAAR
ncbi:MAG TPA: hypothetical protein VF862_07550 [Gemmatimonadales bacterium]